MTEIWNKISYLAQQIENKFQDSGEKFTGCEQSYDWYNSLYRSIRFRRAHIEIVDKRDSHGIYILHATVFPHCNDPSPIWGFDAICGKSKITGAFHDFSNGGDSEHKMMEWFKDKVSGIKWSKPRDLPTWAKEIFSASVIAAGNLKDIEEIDKLCSLALNTLDYYLANVGNSQTCGFYFHMVQNRYCYYQKQNPHVIKSMIAMDIPEPTISKFIEEVLFPEI
jgi:hypothetical protein